MIALSPFTLNDTVEGKLITTLVENNLLFRLYINKQKYNIHVVGFVPEKGTFLRAFIQWNTGTKGGRFT